MSANNDSSVALPDETVMNKIYVIRAHKVMLDRDLAELYQVETKYLNQVVNRNSNRFPGDFMFQLDAEEFKSLKFQIGTSTATTLTQTP